MSALSPWGATASCPTRLPCENHPVTDLYDPPKLTLGFVAVTPAIWDRRTV